MKLSRIVLEEFRKFRQPLALDGLQPGLNLFVGPNRPANTVAAAIRAAFLERYSTKTVADLAPRGESGARPSVELAFSHAGRDYVLKKQFLTKARCELLIDGGAERLDGRRPRMRWRRCWASTCPDVDRASPSRRASRAAVDPAGRGPVAQRAGWPRPGPSASADAPVRRTGGRRWRQAVRARVRRARRCWTRATASQGRVQDADEALARAARDDALRAKAQLDADVDRLAAAPGTWAGAASRALEGAGSAGRRGAHAPGGPGASARRWKACAASWRRPPATWACCRIRSGATSRMKTADAGTAGAGAAERLRQSEAPLARAAARRATRRRRRGAAGLDGGAGAGRSARPGTAIAPAGRRHGAPGWRAESGG